nr:AAA family ATPase [Alteraurantiacibacter buctensis]
MASDITPVQFARKTIYPLRKNDVDLGAISALIGQGGGDVTPTAPLPHVLIIDEINRANVSKVFGELITLIEPDKRLGMPNSLTLTLPYSKKTFGVPANLHIIGTMNTADRSIALLDTALRRRFTFREVAPESRLLPEQVDGVPLRRLLDRINDRIEYLIDRDHRIGHAFFMACGSRDEIDRVMSDNVIPLLQEYFFEDWSRIHAVVGDGFIGRRDLAPPPGIEADSRPSWFIRPRFAADAYDRLIAGSEAIPTPDDEYGDAAGGDET